MARSTAAQPYADVRIRYNSDTASNYFGHYIYAEGSTAGGAFAGSSTSFIFGAEIAAASSAASIFGVFVVDILDYASVNKNKVLRSLNGVDRNGSGYVYFHSGTWNNSSTAINSMNFTLDAGSFAQYSSFTLYGIK
jgi:hypothetical protein